MSDNGDYLNACMKLKQKNVYRSIVISHINTNCTLPTVDDP